MKNEIKNIIIDLKNLNERNKRDFGLLYDNWSIYLRLCAYINKLEKKFKKGK